MWFFFVYGDFDPGTKVANVVFVFVAEVGNRIEIIPAMIEFDRSSPEISNAIKELEFPLEILNMITADDAVFSPTQSVNPHPSQIHDALRYEIASEPMFFNLS